MSEVARDFFYHITVTIPSDIKDRHDVREHILLSFHNDELIDGILESDSPNGFGKIIEGVESFEQLETLLKDNNSENFVCYIYEGNVDQRLKNLKHFLKGFPVDLKVEKRECEDWNKEWMKYYEPIDLGDSYKVIPFHKRESDQLSEKEIFISPGQGFGTGSHETTYLCLKELINLSNSKEEIPSVLDFGCGSGILGIAAIKWFKSAVCFMDIDPRALDNCVENISLNFSEQDLSQCSVVSRERFNPSEDYNLVFANILSHVLISESQLITKLVALNGVLILSGIISGQEAQVIEVYESLNLTLVKKDQKNEWIALVMEKR